MIHSTPYVKEYDRNGTLLNPITKGNPYLVYPKHHRRKIRKRVSHWEYVQIIPIFKDRNGRIKKLSKIVWGFICGKPYAPNLQFVGTKRIIHEKR